MNIRRVKNGASITYYNGIFMMLFGIYIILFEDFNMKTNFKSISQLWGFFSKYNPEISYIFFLFNLLIGVLLISGGFIIVYLSDFIYKRKEKIAWVILFIFGIAEWVSLLIVSFLLKNVIFISVGFIGWIIFIIGMILPIQYYLEKAYREY